ncbi:MAG: DUF1848 domain-containing protein [Clostridia bacterium]|nr:DUF1848 domain-containing protein [Clostridia bacterium]
MIISASRRTDIPALYTEWFLRRLAAGSVRVPNPMNARQVRTISLRPGDVDGFVFWTKNPAPMTGRLAALGDIPLYFQCTLTPYGPELEPGLPDTAHRVAALRRLSEQIGPDRVTWRYDPVLLGAGWTQERHEEAFGAIAHALRGAVKGGVFSFLDRYRKIEGVLRTRGIEPWTDESMRGMAAGLARIAHAEGLTLETCAEPLDLSGLGIGHARCVDASRLGLTGAPKDPNQRGACGCAASVDIGMYDSCVLGCAYCYANAGTAAAMRNHAAHDPDGDCLIPPRNPAGDTGFRT